MNAVSENNFAARLLLERGGVRKEKTALRCSGREVSYGELAAMAGRMAAVLRAQGLAPGDRILTALPDNLSGAVVLLGCFWAGVVAAVANNRVLREDYAAHIKSCGVRFVFAAGGHAALEAAAQCGAPCFGLDDDGLDAFLARPADGFPPHPVAEGDDAVILSTSGSTGYPRNIPHSHGDYRAVAESGWPHLELRSDDVVLSTAKLFHAYGQLSSLSIPLWGGATVVLNPDKPAPMAVLDLIARHRVTVLTSSPSFYAMLLMSAPPAETLASLRLCLSAGESLPAAVQTAWKDKTGLDIWQGYGSTESLTINVGTRPPYTTPGITGRAIPPYEAAVLDEAHRPVPDGTIGELGLKGPSLARQYLDNPAETARMYGGDGWLLTGDLGRMEDGVVTVLGRKSEMFKAGGQWVSPIRVENVLLEHPAVAECGVTAGLAAGFTLVSAHVVVAPGREGDRELAGELVRFAAGRLPDFMVPSDIRFRKDLPRTPLGKIQRFALR